jgi:hypothetical protein
MGSAADAALPRHRQKALARACVRTESQATGALSELEGLGLNSRAGDSPTRNETR